MKIQCRIVLALASLAGLAFAEDLSKDDMWRRLNQSHGEAGIQSLPAGDSMEEMADRIRRMMKPENGDEFSRTPGFPPQLHAEAGIETWPEANLKYEFAKGWSKGDDSMWNGLLRTYFTNRDRLTFAVAFVALTRGDNTPHEELLKVVNTSQGLADLKVVEATGRAKELGITMSEATCTVAALKSQRAVIGRLIRNGGIYGFTMIASDIETARSEFTRILATLSWIDEAKDLSLPPIDALSVEGAGFSISCEGSLLAATASEIPFGSAAFRNSQRLEIAAFDVRGMELPLRELATSMLESMGIGAGGNYEFKETEWGGVPALYVSPRRKSNIMGRTMDWRMNCAVRDGFFCIALGYWEEGGMDVAAQHGKVVERVVFSPPAGETRKLTKEGELAYAGLIYNQIGMKAFEKGQFNISTKAFERSVDLSAKDVTSVLNLINSISQQGRIQRALEVVERHAESFPDHDDMKLWRASLLAQNGRHAASAVIYEELFKSGLRDQTQLTIWINALQESGRMDRAAEVAKLVYDEGGQVSWRRILANCLWTAGKLDEARAHFKELAEELGQEIGFVSDYASLLAEMGDHHAVLGLVTEWETSAEASPALLFSKGMAQTGLGWFKDAVETFTKLDEVVPGNQTVKEALGNAQAMLGRGSQEGIREDLQAVALPSMLTQRAADAMAETRLEVDFAGEGLVVLEDVQAWEWIEGNDAKVTHRQRIKVLDASGVTDYSTLYVPFKPYSERVNINRMIVTDEQGRKIAAFRKEEMYIRDGGGELADGGKIVCIPVPALTEGCQIEFVHTKILLGTSDRFPMTLAAIPEYNALVYGAVAFTGEIAKIRFAHTEPTGTVEGDSWRAYEGRKIQRRKGLSHTPPLDRWGMICWAADKRLTWEDEVKDYLGEIRDCLADEDFAVKVVEELALAGKSPQEVTRIVVRWLNGKFQYQGLEFGRRARIPANGATTLARGFGDCKDLSVMVRAVLRKAGVKAELALVSSSGVLREDIPGLDQFDHMVLYLPDLGGTVLDATMRHFNTPEALTSSAVGNRALVIEGASPRFVEMKEAAGVGRLMEVERQLRISPESGDANLVETVLMSPPQAAIMRYVLSATPGADHLKTVESMMRRKEPRLELKKFEVHDLADPFKTLRIELEYTVAGAFQKEDKVLSGTAPGVFERWFFELEQERDRNLGLMIRVSERCTVRTRIVPPDGHQWIAPDTLEQREAELGSFDGSLLWKADGDGIVMDASMELIPSEGDASLHQRIQKASEGMFRHLGARIKFRAGN